jgi:endonuclease/exonuclease/phosphatase (EEP) superfamily protein YafD
VQHGLYGLALLLIAATLLPFWRSPRWWIRVWDFPRVQLSLAICACGIGLWVTANPHTAAQAVATAGLAAAAAIHLAHIWRYTPLAPVQVPRANPETPRARRLRILFANVLASNRRADALIALIADADPDLVLLVETDGWWDRELGLLAPRFRHVLRHPLANTYGMHLLSMLPLRNQGFRFLVEPDVPSAFAEVQLASGEWIVFFGVHPRPPRPAQDTDERDAELLIVGHEAREGRLPAIVSGDLNDVAWSYTTRLFQRISGLLDPRIGRGLYSTFHAQIPLLRWPLDHLFHDARFTLVELRRLPAFGSDHFPVLVELAFEPERAHEIHVPAPAPGDRMFSARAILRAFPRGARHLRERLGRRRRRRH